METGNKESMNVEEFISKQNPALYTELCELAKLNKTSVIDELNRNLSLIREKNPKFFQDIKAKFPELITKQDAVDVLNLQAEGLGRLYYDENGSPRAEGWLATAVSIGPDGFPIIAEHVKPYNAEYLNQIMNRMDFPHLNLGLIRVPEGSGIEKCDGMIDPTTAALLAVTLKGRSEKFGNEKFKHEL